MKPYAIILVTLALGSIFAGREPAPYRSIAERVRVSTHVVVGEVQAVHVISEATGKEVRSPAADLDDGQRIELEIIVGEVLQADKSREAKPGNKLKVRFGKRGHTPSVFKEMLSGKRLIFFLSQDAEHAARFDYFYPFYGETNLAELPNKLETTKAAIAKLRDASQ